MSERSPIPASLLQDLVAFRHHLHQHPELSGEELSTQASIMKHFQGSDFEVETVPDFTGVSATLPGKDRSRSLVLRADIDALPIQEKSRIAWSSKKDGVMHACGHDGHTTILIGLAKVLQTRKELYPIDIQLIFQPAEETGLGAPKMLQSLVQAKKAQQIFGLHGWPGLELGQASVVSGAIMGSVDNFVVRLHGKGAHAAQPHRGRDPVVLASQIVTSAQSLVSRISDPLEPCALTFGEIRAGTVFNVIPESALLKGTIRALNEETRLELVRKLESLCIHLAKAFDMKAEVDWVENCPVTVNHSQAVDIVRSSIKRELGVSHSLPPSLAGEDFSHYLRAIPGAFFWLGVGSEKPPLHNPTFDFADDAIEIGIQLFLRIIETFSDIARKA